MNWRKWVSMGMAAALVVSLSNLDMVRAAEDTQEKTATAYLYFTDGHWTGDINYHKPEGDEQTKTKAVTATVSKDGIYHLELDFTQTQNQKSNLCSETKICISDGENIFGKNSVITLEKVVINNLERTIPSGGITAGKYNWNNNGSADTVFYLYSGGEAENNFNQLTDKRGKGAPGAFKDLNLFSEFGMTNVEKLEVDFSFSINGETNPSESSNPNSSSNPNESSDPNKTPLPSGSQDPNNTPLPSHSTNPNKTPLPSSSQKPNKTPLPSGSQNPNKTPNPYGTTAPPVNTSQAPNQAGVVSNSTYTGAEKILVQKQSVVIPAGGNNTITFALLRSAASSTQVSVSSGNTKIAVPVLQDNGKVRINVPGTASPGSSTTVTLRFGSSSASVNVTVKNAVTKIKAAKKTYKIKRRKKTKVAFKLTTQNKSNKTTEEPVVKLSGKKAAISSVKVSGSKLTVTVKGVKKGSATLKVTISGKTAKTKLKIK